MFQGSENVEKGQHFRLVQAAGGTLNASTRLDRTNYYETLPGHELEMALWLEADRMGDLLPAMTQEKLDNQRDVVKNERRWSVDNQPYGDWDERIQALVYPEGIPTTTRRSARWRTSPPPRSTTSATSSPTGTRPNNAVLTIAGDFETDAALAMIERHFGPIPAMTGDAAAARHGRRPADRRRTPGDRAGRRPAPPRLPRAPDPAVRHRCVRRRSTWPPTSSARAARRASTPASCASSGWPRTPASSSSRSSAGRACSRSWVTARPGVAPETLEAATLAESRAPGRRRPDRGRPRAGAEPARLPRRVRLERIGERADRSRCTPPIFDDPGRVNAEVARYAAVDSVSASP